MMAYQLPRYVYECDNILCEDHMCKYQYLKKEMKNRNGDPFF
jgi:hypothetical protein